MKQLNILIIDDEFIARTQLRSSLEALGHIVVEFSDPEAAIERLKDNLPDIVMTDLRMPVMSGEDILKALTAEYPDLPLIVVSGTADIHQAVMALRTGAWDFVVKPVADLELLRMVINRVVERSLLIIENRAYQNNLEKLVSERASELHKLSQVATQSPVTIMITNPEGTIEFVNPRFTQTTGYSSEEVIGGNPRLLKSGQTPDAVYSQLWDTITSGGVWEGDLLNRKKDGELFMEHAIISAIKDQKGIITHYLSIKEDITEKRRLAEEARLAQIKLIQADKLASLGLLVSGVAHEINNPNNFIMNNAAHLAEAWSDAMPILTEYYRENGDFELGDLMFSEAEETLPRLFYGLTDGAHRIRNIVERLKNFARVDAGNTAERTDLNMVILDALVLLKHEINKRCERFSFNPDDSVPDVRANAQQIGQVIINLIMNALQSLEDKGQEVSVSLQATGDREQVSVEVRDCGCGMSPELLQRITEPFFTTKGDRGGTGLGLSVSLALVHDNGGELHFESDPGHGTTASLLLKAFTG